MSQARAADAAQHASTVDGHKLTASSEAEAAVAASEQLKAEHAAALEAHTEAHEQHKAQLAEELEVHKAGHSGALAVVVQEADTLKSKLSKSDKRFAVACDCWVYLSCASVTSCVLGTFA